MGHNLLVAGVESLVVVIRMLRSVMQTVDVLPNALLALTLTVITARVVVGGMNNDQHVPLRTALVPQDAVTLLAVVLVITLENKHIAPGVACALVKQVKEVAIDLLPWVKLAAPGFPLKQAPAVTLVN